MNMHVFKHCYFICSSIYRILSLVGGGGGGGGGGRMELQCLALMHKVCISISLPTPRRSGSLPLTPRPPSLELKDGN